MALEKNIILFTSTFGGGHQRVAEVIGRQIYPNAEIKVVDFFELVSPALNSLLRFAYIKSVNLVPRAYGAFYEFMDGDSLFQIFLDSLGRKKIKELFDKSRPYVAVSTYPTPAGVISSMISRGETAIKNVTVITDFVVHRQWIHPNTDLYLVPSQTVKQGLITFGIDQAKIEVTGMPLDPRFEMEFSEEGLRKKWEVDPGAEVVMVMAGVYGMGRVDELVYALKKIDRNFISLIICGRDDRLRRRLLDRYAQDQTMRVLGFVNEVFELMSFSSLIITKAGGVTVSEAIRKGVPMVIFKPIPGQELRNVRFLSDKGAALIAYSEGELVEQVDRLLGDGRARSRLGESALSLALPNSAQKAAEAILSLMDERVTRRSMVEGRYGSDRGDRSYKGDKH